MKHMNKRFLPVLLTLVLLLSLMPGTALSVEDSEAAMPEPQVMEAEVCTTPASSMPTGRINVEIPGGRAITDGLVASTQNVQATIDLPTYYNSTELGYVTPVRDQNPWGTCWAHGALASVESYMIKHGIIDGSTGEAATTGIDLSEYQLVTFAYNDAYDALGMLTGDSTRPTPTPGENFVSYILDSGGYGGLATFTLMRWEGVASETTAALNYDVVRNNYYPEELSSEYAYAYDVAHVQSVDWIPTSNRDAVKRAIMENGSATFGYGHYDQFANYSNGAYYCPYNKNVNHDVTVVGWDDNYAVSNFNSGYRPSKPGAWIIKNSWGTGIGDYGYFYISYYDVPSSNDTCYFYYAEAVDNYDNNYQYDGTGLHSWYSFETNGISIANVFTSNGKETLEAVALATFDEATSYTMNIYAGLTSTAPTSGTLALTQTGTIEWSGYHTIKLDSPVSLSEGEKYSVVFTLSTPAPDTDGIYLNIPIDYSYTREYTDGSADNYVHTLHSNTSYYSSNGTYWSDVSDDCSFRIKAYTKNVSHLTGDLNGDNKVNNRDALILFRWVSNIRTGVTIPEAWLDVNHDTKINNQDALMLFRAASGLITLT